MEIKVYKGGIDPDNNFTSTFVKAEATDTRLMGVVGLHMQWLCQYDNNTKPVSTHYYLYCDYEELGLEYIHHFVFHENERQMEDYHFKSYFGGLGGNKVSLSQMEALFLVKEFIDLTKSSKLALPKEIIQMNNLLSHYQSFSDSDKQALYSKICASLETDCGVINSYLMRCFGKDIEGALIIQSASADILDPSSIGFDDFGTFLHNNIEKREEENTYYLCESLVESANYHYIVTNELTLDNMKVSSCRRLSCMKISTYEASLLLNVPEYVTVFELSTFPESFYKEFEDYTIGFTQTQHDTGIMFIEYNSNNKHVEKASYILSGDVACIYYLTAYGQLLVASNTVAGILHAENSLINSSFCSYLNLTDRYNFPQAVLYEFAESGCLDFNEFIEEIESE